ncbi:hypothetical protein KFL_001180180 [Klebsormidium nitens]|uniref:Uncharacterized protein n=1 Tax=Klebsormidium nitens TaxID=105231 RepID=A0A1Y1HZM5_KLENI|nr:hypothetical protein KFL_001180180 [Klebsormidium nitens]|eukprot:GAQ82639.1 hypothetical protein KFL_001180180 [Klebsormidium nitens]
MAAGAVMLKAGVVAGPALHYERGSSASQISPRFEMQGFHLAPATFTRTSVKHRVAPHRPAIRAQANSRDASSPGSSPPGEIKQTVQREVGVSAGKGSPGSSGPPNDSPVSSSSKHAKVAKQLHDEDPNSFEARVLNSSTGKDSVSDSGKHWQQASAAGVPSAVDKLAGQFEQRQAKKVQEVSKAVQGTMSYAAVAQNLRHEGPKPGPIRSEVLDRAAPKQQDRTEERPQSDERPFKEPRQESTLNLDSQTARKLNLKSLAAIVAILFIAFGFAPVWSPIVGRVLTPFFQLVGVAVAVKFFFTDFLRADKRKELYKKGEKLKEDVTGS